MSAQPADPRATASAWSPLRHTLFRNLWIATIVSNVGTWMQDVGAGWLMTSLSSSPSMVALVEAADGIPLMLLALPAGALADIIDRRRLLVGIQVYLLVVAGALAVCTFFELTTAWGLIGFIFALGVFLGLVVGIIVVYQILYTDVTDHLQEYATLKAIGYKDSFLFAIIIQESVILSVFGYIPGFFIALLIYGIARDATFLPLRMTPERGVVVYVLTVGMCVLSGALALRRLRRADPAEIF